ncbi:MAG TPA: flagellin hook IN motif-containing protein, partial [Candidatus Wallbacteria bacterium]|nr:flagellin hook IN motif-containing protein [Candidatus Wallbacteria bacterium]
MMINTNLSSMNATRNLNGINQKIDKSLQKLSSGLRINGAEDDASGLAIASLMAQQLSGMTSSVQNTQDALATLNIADGAMSQNSSILSRMEELAVRGANGTLSSSDRAAIAAEMSQLSAQINTNSDNAQYNGMKLIDGSMQAKTSATVNTGASGSISVLSPPSGTANINAVALSIITAGTAAISTGAANATAGAIGASGTISVNGTDINVSSSDTADTVISKINAQNSKTGVVAVKSTTGTGAVSLISGKIDSDAANVVGAGSTTANSSAIGYTTTGTGATIAIGGDNGIWGQMGFTGALAGYSASGTNTVARLGGTALTSNGSVLEMTNSGSPAYGIKIGTNLFNGANGGYILNNQATAAAAVQNISANGDQGTISADTSPRMQVQIGANYGQSMQFGIPGTDANSLGRGASSKFSSLADISFSSASDANTALKVIQQAVNDVAG